MGTQFKRENGQVNVYWNSLFVASIHKISKEQALSSAPAGWGHPHYALAYINGRYERFEHYLDAAVEAKKIMGKKDILGKTILY